MHCTVIAHGLRDRRFTVAFVDFFDEEIKQVGGDWKKVAEQYLYSGPEPLINGYSGGRMFNPLFAQCPPVLC